MLNPSAMNPLGQVLAAHMERRRRVERAQAALASTTDELVTDRGENKSGRARHALASDAKEASR